MKKLRHALLAAFAASTLAACLSGGGSGSDGTTATPQASGVNMLTVPPSEYGTPTANEASRFLTQASMGPTASEIAKVQQYGYSAWLADQFAMPPRTYTSYINTIIAGLPADQSLQDSHVMNAFWWNVGGAQDQLRIRVAFALSQIFVVSLQDGGVAQYKRGVASYLDMLGKNAFGNYRTLLEDVSRHPMMGIYLSHLRNQKEDPARNRVPDQNYAREIMQLFSIGLYELNTDGTQRLSGGQPIPTYTPDDIVGLSRVFTGFSWAGPDKTNGRFFGNSTPAPDPNRDILPMQGYPAQHSISEKRFLTAVIPASGASDPDGDLRIALDTIAGHPNVGPFLGKLLIQRLVTSNPSPAYVGRVATAFNTGRFTSGQYTVGTGVRGDLMATVAAVLLDRDARMAATLSGPNVGRVREPILRLSTWMRAFNARSTTGYWLLGTTDDVNTQLGQSPLRSPTVFNFYRPGYVPPNTAIAAAGLVAPEFQVTHETSVVGYSNFMRSVVQSGVGSNSPRDIQPDYTAELALADNADRLIDRVDMLLTYGTLTPETRTIIRDAINAITIPATNPTAARQNRVYTAVFFVLSSPDFIVQK